MYWRENGRELAARRKSLDWTTADLARRSGVSRSIIANIESRRTVLKGEVASKLWNTIVEADVKRRLQNAGFEGYSNGMAEQRVADLFPNLAILSRLGAQKISATSKAATRAGITGEIAALHEQLTLSTSLITSQAVLLAKEEERMVAAQAQIASLKAEVSALRDQLGADIRRLEAELGHKLQLASRQGAVILAENKVEAVTGDPLVK